MQTWDLKTLEVEPHHPQVLVSQDEGRAIAINLPAGEQLQEHQTHERSWLIVADGEITIDGTGDTINAGPGVMTEFAPNERREVTATTDTRLLLILSPWPGEGHPSQNPKS